VIKTAPRCALARAERSSKDGLSFPSRVRITWKPCASSALFVAVANCSTSLLSLMPPCHARPDPFPHVRGIPKPRYSKLNAALAAEVWRPIAPFLRLENFLHRLPGNRPCDRHAAHPCGDQGASQNRQEVGEDLTPSRIPNLNAIVGWKRPLPCGSVTYLECGSFAPAFTG